MRACEIAILGVVAVVLLWIFPAQGPTQIDNWQAQVRKYAEAKDWDSAMRIVEQEIARRKQPGSVALWDSENEDLTVGTLRFMKESPQA